MKLRKRNELLNDILHKGKKHPTGWMASFRKNYHHLSDDYYLHHPKIGLFYLKEFQKNPIKHIGIGGKVARKIDEDVTEELQKNSQRFGIIQGNIRKITHNIKNGISPDEIIQGMIDGEDKGITMPITGKASQSSEPTRKMKDHGKENQKKIERHFQKVAKENGLYDSYD